MPCSRHILSLWVGLSKIQQGFTAIKTLYSLNHRRMRPVSSDESGGRYRRGSNARRTLQTCATFICLRGLGYARVGKARERNEEAIRSWRRKTWPGLQRRPHAGLHRRKRIESEAASLPQLGAARENTRAVVQLQLGEAPVWADAAQLLLPALSRGDRPSRGDRLSQSAAASHDKPLLIVWDRLPAHRSRLVREFIELSEGHIVMEYLPPYAPELNPVEYIWSYWKQHAAQCLSERLRGAEPARSPSAAPHAPQTALDYCLLEAVFSLL